MKSDPNFGLSRVLTLFSEYFGLNRTMSLVAVCFVAGVTCFAVFWFIRSAPPRVMHHHQRAAGQRL